QMAEMDGIEATVAIRRSEPRGDVPLPIIAMTAHALESDRERCRAAGMSDYVSKPIEPDALFAAIERATATVRAVLTAPRGTIDTAETSPGASGRQGT